MPEYIEREEINKAMKEVCDDPSCPMHVAAEIAQIIDCAPTADVAPVVHCSECENAENECGGMIICRVYKHIMWLQDFCSYGKRKDGGADNG